MTKLREGNSSKALLAVVLGGVGAVVLSQASAIRAELQLQMLRDFHAPALSAIQEYR